MRVIVLDSHIFVWGIREYASEGQEEMIPRAKGFLRQLNEEEPIILLPSVVLFELLLPIPLARRNQFLSRFQSGFMVMPFDAPSAQAAAEVWHTKAAEGVIEEVRADPNASRHALKADTQIIGTAIAHGASTIYSHDDKLRKMADGFIDVVEMDYELDLFELAEVERKKKEAAALKAVAEETEEESTTDEADGILADTGYSPAAREAIRRRLAEEPNEGPEEEDFNRDVQRAAEERKDD